MLNKLIISYFLIYTFGLSAYSVAQSQPSQAEIELTKKWVQSQYLAELQELKQELNLTEDQMKSLTPIYEDYAAKNEELIRPFASGKGSNMFTDDFKDKRKALDDEFKQNLSSILSAEQMDKYNQINTMRVIQIDQESVESSLGLMERAIKAYATANGDQYPTDSAALDSYVGGKDYNSCNSTHNGYTITCDFNSTNYTVQAAPETKGETGILTYILDKDGIHKQE